jgi:hypothetical protein
MLTPENRPALLTTSSVIALVDILLDIAHGDVSKPENLAIQHITLNLLTNFAQDSSLRPKMAYSGLAKALPALLNSGIEQLVEVS